MDLDFSAAADPSKRFDAHVAVQSYSRGYGAPTPTGLVGPYLIDGSTRARPAQGARRGALRRRRVWGFDAAVDGDDKKLAADYRFSAGDYALLVRGGPWGGRQGPSARRGRPEVTRKRRGAGRRRHGGLQLYCISRLPTRTPTCRRARPDDAGPRLDGATAVASVELYRIDGPSLAAAADGVARADVQPHADAGAVAQTHADDVANG